MKIINTDQEFIDFYPAIFENSPFQLRVNNELLTLSSDKINGEEHYCLSVHYNNIIHGSYIEPKRIRQPLDNCNTCFHILNIEK